MTNCDQQWCLPVKSAETQVAFKLCLGPALVDIRTDLHGILFFLLIVVGVEILRGDECLILEFKGERIASRLDAVPLLIWTSLIASLNSVLLILRISRARVQRREVASDLP